MRRYEIDRIDRIEFAGFGKVAFEMGGVDLDLRQMPATPATVSPMIFVRLNCTRRCVRARQDDGS